MFLYPNKIKAEHCTQLPLKAPQMRGCFAAEAKLEGSGLRGHAPSDFSFTNMPKWGKSRALQNNMFVDWCKEHFLELNVKKTKELIFDFRQTNNSHDVVQIGSDSVEQVHEYKYLGVVFDDKLEWHSHADKITKKMNQRLYFLRKLNSFNVNITILNLFSNSCILSILKFCLCAWGGNINLILTKSCHTTLVKLCKDSSHPLFKQIKF